MNPSRKILIGLASGIALGLFLGENAAIFKWPADGFVRLLQMTVLPYVFISIIGSLGTLQVAEAKVLGKRVGAVLAVLALIAVIFALLFSIAFPEVETAAFFSTNLLEERQSFNFLDLYIPSNPFYSLANNIVPAVVLFSIVLGIALIGIEKKQILLNQLSIASDAISRATRMISRLTPYGLFAIGALVAGTFRIEQVQKIQVYLFTYNVVACLVSFWVLPALVSTLTSIPHREVLKSSKDALITAFVAGDLFIVLPSLIESSKELLLRYTKTGENEATLPDVIVPASFNFPHTGKLLSLSFILFAGWATDALLPLSQYPQLASVGVLTFFGSLNSAIPFLLDYFQIPADAFQLFLATGVINARFGALVAAVHTVTVGVLASAAITGNLRFNARRIAGYCIVTSVLVILVFGGLRLLFTTTMRDSYHGGKQFMNMMPVMHKEEATVLQTIPPADDTKEPALPRSELIRNRGTLRICFLPDRMPYAFYNNHKQLVGFGVEMGLMLGRDLGVRSEFVPADLNNLKSFLENGQCDLAMSGLPLTPQRASDMLFTEPFLDETLAFVVKDHLRHRFEGWEKIRAIRDITIGVPNVPYYIKEIERRAPALKLKVLPSDVHFPDIANEFDAVVLPAERGSIYTLLHPDFTVVVPKPGLIKVPLAYPVARRDLDWMTFINRWIDLKRKDGTIETLYEHWILGKFSTETQPRWSIMRNVLHLEN